MGSYRLVGMLTYQVVSVKLCSMASAFHPPASTRDRMIDEARALFAERGFYGVSIAQIAAELGMTKQALLHHFTTKERLYGLVLEQIADQLTGLQQQLNGDASPAQRVEDWLVAMISDTPQRVERSRLLMREILDNQVRAQHAGAWYLKPFLEEFAALLRDVPGWSGSTDAQLRATLLQLLGAVSYHAVSGPTVQGIFGADAAQAMDAIFAGQMRHMVRAVLAAGPAVEGQR
jgi:AcrR family transcriptional regulator